MSTRAAKPWRRRKAASAVALRKDYGWTSKGFRPLVPSIGEAYACTSRAAFLQAEGATPRRTPLIGK